MPFTEKKGKTETISFFVFSSLSPLFPPSPFSAHGRNNRYFIHTCTHSLIINCPLKAVGTRGGSLAFSVAEYTSREGKDTTHKAVITHRMQPRGASGAIETFFRRFVRISPSVRPFLRESSFFRARSAIFVPSIFFSLAALSLSRAFVRFDSNSHARDKKVLEKLSIVSDGLHLPRVG